MVFCRPFRAYNIFCMTDSTGYAALHPWLTSIALSGLNVVTVNVINLYTRYGILRHNAKALGLGLGHW